MGALKYCPFVGGIDDCFLALIGEFGGLEIRCAAQISILFQNAQDSFGIPAAGIIRVVTACPACALKLNRPRRWDFPLFQHPGNFAGAVALHAQLENQLHHGGGFFIHQKMSVLALNVAVGGV